jgi:hypothetical protein
VGNAQSPPVVVTSGSLGAPAVCCALAAAGLAKHLEDHVRRVVDAAPPLTAEQRDKLALLLGGSRV